MFAADRPLRAPDRWLVALVFLVSVLFLTPFRLQFQWPIDEGIFVYGAERIVNGDVLYRDFFEPFMPGAFYLLVGLFQIFGLHVLVARLAVILCNAVILALVYLLARRLLSRWLSLIPVGLLMVLFYRADLATPHRQFALMAGLAALLLSVWDLESAPDGERLEAGRPTSDVRRPTSLGTRRRWWFSTGLATGLAFLFVPAMGLSVGMTLLLFRWLDARLSPRPQLWSGFLAFFLGGALLLPALALVQFNWQGTAREMLYTALIWPFTAFPALGTVPYGHPYTVKALVQDLAAADHVLLRLQSALFLFVLAAPFLGCLGSLWVLWFRRRTGVYGSYERTLLLFLLAVLAQLGLVMGAPRFAVLLWVSPLSVILTVRLFQFPEAATFSVSTLWRALVVTCLVALCVDYGTGLLVNLPTSPVSTRRGTLLTHPNNVPYFRTLFRFIEGHVKPHHQLYFYPAAPMYYFLSETRNPIRFDALSPDLNTPQQLEQAINDLHRERPHYVIWDTRAMATILGSLLDKQVPENNPLEDYLRKHYRPIRLIPLTPLAVIGGVSELLILERRDRAEGV